MPTETQNRIQIESTAVAHVAMPAQMPHVPEPQRDFAHKTAHWIHQHPNATKSVPGYIAYHLARGTAAAVPYGISMGTTLGAMAGLQLAGEKMAQTAAAGSFKAGFGSRLAQFAAFPAVKLSMLVATSFTLYRGTQKIGKWMHDRLFDPKDTEEQTAEKIKHLPADTWQKMKDNAPAGIGSTPIAAFALGFVNSTFAKGESITKKTNGVSLDWTRANFLEAKSQGKALEVMGDTIGKRGGKFFEQAAIYTLGYSLFFELGDRLFKDRQLSRDKWKGETFSTNPKKPEEPLPEKKHFGFFTNESSIGRFVFRRMLPTAVSITAYTAAKFRWTYMLIGDFVPNLEKAKSGEKSLLKQVPGLIGIETVAVLWFSMIPAIGEAWERVYDKFFAKLEKSHADKPALAAAPLKLESPETPGKAVEERSTQPSHKVVTVINHGKTVEAPEQMHVVA